MTMSGARHRRKGDRLERELVARHKALGIHAERYPLSGASRFRGSGHDVDVYLFGRDAAPIVVEVKARKSGGGFVQLEKWLANMTRCFCGVIVLTRSSCCRGAYGRACSSGEAAMNAQLPITTPQHDLDYFDAQGCPDLREIPPDLRRLQRDSGVGLGAVGYRQRWISHTHGRDRDGIEHEQASRSGRTLPGE